MEIKRLRNLALEVDRTEKGLDPEFTKNKFSIKTNVKVTPNDIKGKMHKSAIFGDNQLTTLGPRIWMLYHKT